MSKSWGCYCVRCDSFEHAPDGTALLERRDSGLWCNVCWDWAQPLPKRVSDVLVKAEESAAQSIVGPRSESIVPSPGS